MLLNNTLTRLGVDLHSPSPILNLDWDYFDIDWTGLDLGLGNWIWAGQIGCCRIRVSATIPVPFLFRFETLDLDLGLRTWTWA